jgi:DNA-binding transcriptional LysR family regulator
MKSSPDWEDLKFFLAVARGGSLSAAARSLHTSPATVGRRITVLEGRLQTRLFDRRQSGYGLTESGESIKLKAEDVEEAVFSVEREASGRDLRASGKVRVATAEDIAAVVIAPRLKDFRQTHPGISVELIASWDVVNLTRREADVAIRTVRPMHGDFVMRQIGIWDCGLYASKEYASKHRLSPGAADFDSADVITWTEDHSFRGGDWFKDNGRGPRSTFAANSRQIQYAACRAGLGLAILPCLSADRDFELIQLLPADKVRSVKLWLVAHRDLVRTARVRAVMDFLVDIVPKN